MSQGREPTKVLVQCNKIELKVTANISADNIFLSDREIEYIWIRIAIGAHHQKATGSKAKERTAPAIAEKSRFTNPKH